MTLYTGSNMLAEIKQIKCRLVVEEKMLLKQEKHLEAWTPEEKEGIETYVR